ncbi:hypothetical protein LA080_010157 [Diaporthe eres]|nr:hypothetical protein LA080_010157 [Diaporthe eres]
MSIGPLTTTFTPPAECTGTESGIIRAISGSSYFVTAGAAASSCFPSGVVPDSTDFYSPGVSDVKLSVYTPSVAFRAMLELIGVLRICEVVLGPNAANALPRLSQSSTDTAGRLTLTSPIINAIVLQRRYQSTDSAILGSATSIIYSTSTTASQPSSDSELSGGTVAGIVVGVIAVLALIIGACIYLFVSKRRKAGVAQDDHIQDADQDDGESSTNPRRCDHSGISTIR